jgi:hypothetical protein
LGAAAACAGAEASTSVPAIIIKTLSFKRAMRFSNVDQQRPCRQIDECLLNRKLLHNRPV